MPLETGPRDPSAPSQSRTSIRGDRPASIAAITAGHASCADANRPRILFDGISRSEYPTAPSMTMPNPSLLGLACRPASPPALARLAGAERALKFVCISFALRSAPCGNDAWPVATIGGYHGQEAAPQVAAGRDERGLFERMGLVKPLDLARVPERHNCFVEADAVLPDILGLLGSVTAVLDHAPDTTDGRLPATYFGIGAQ